MPVPSGESRHDALDETVQTALGLVRQARELAVAWQTNLQLNTPIYSIIRGIYIPYARAEGCWHGIVDARAFGKFTEAYLEQIGLTYRIGTSDVSVAQQGLIVGANSLQVGDPVVWRGIGVLPAPFVVGTRYQVLEKPTPTTIRLANTPGGVLVPPTDVGVDINVLNYDIDPEFDAMLAAIEAVVDEIINIVPVANPSNGILGERFDKALAFGSTGLEQRVLTPAETVNLRALLAAVQNAVEIPQ